MSADLSINTPLGSKLNELIQPKLIEIGWSTGGPDDSAALSEYIILMLVNGKTQDQIANELSGDLLNLGPDDPGARDFAQWLFEQVEYYSQGDRATAGPEIADAQQQPEEHGDTFAQDADMDDGQDGTGASMPPTGPKSMRNGGERNRDKRLFGHLGKAMDRTSDSVLHNVRGHGGAGRINSHSRAPPTGPRSNSARGGRTPNTRGGMANTIPQMTAQQQMDLFSMLEQQSRLMANMFTPQQQQQMMMANGGMMNGAMNGQQQQQQQQSGRSLFERVQPDRGYQNGFRGRGAHQNGRPYTQNQPQNTASSVSAMDMELTPAPAKASPESTCKFNLSCTNKDCIYAHQSPAAPPGTAIDTSDVCSFGAACKNRKCTGRHPSPAQRVAHQVEQDCKFYPNCTNSRCPFRHPTMPLCRNGADCTTENCKFTHVKTACKFNPCLNPQCAFKHEDGQKRGKFEDKVWVAGEGGKREHVSERKFVDEDGIEEELIVPGASDVGMSQDSHTTELVT